jgi:hypothetical protein
MKYEVVKQFDDAYEHLPPLCGFNSPAKWAVVARAFGLAHFKVITPFDVKTDNSYISNFIRSVGPCVMYPLTFGQVVFGYAFRSLADKNFILLSYSPLYLYSSLRTMTSPMHGEMFVYGTIMVISEGVLDAEALSTVWPFSYACLTNHVNDCQAQLISMFTNKVVYFKDNDIAGDKGAEVSATNLRRYDVTCHITRMSSQFKDPGDFIEMFANNGKTPAVDMVREQLAQEIVSYARS